MTCVSQRTCGTISPARHSSSTRATNSSILPACVPCNARTDAFQCADRTNRCVLACDQDPRSPATCEPPRVSARTGRVLGEPTRFRVYIGRDTREPTRVGVRTGRPPESRPRTSSRWSRVGSQMHMAPVCFSEKASLKLGWRLNLLWNHRFTFRTWLGDHGSGVRVSGCRGFEVSGVRFRV